MSGNFYKQNFPSSRQHGLENLPLLQSWQFFLTFNTIQHKYNTYVGLYNYTIHTRHMEFYNMTLFVIKFQEKS